MKVILLIFMVAIIVFMVWQISRIRRQTRSTLDDIAKTKETVAIDIAIAETLEMDPGDPRREPQLRALRERRRAIEHE